MESLQLDNHHTKSQRHLSIRVLDYIDYWTALWKETVYLHFFRKWYLSSSEVELLSLYILRQPLYHMLYGSPKTAFKTISGLQEKSRISLSTSHGAWFGALQNWSFPLLCYDCRWKAMAFNHRTQSCPMVGFSFLITCPDPSEHREKAG